MSTEEKNKLKSMAGKLVQFDDNRLLIVNAFADGLLIGQKLTEKKDVELQEA